jgi:hypothetical protein
MLNDLKSLCHNSYSTLPPTTLKGIGMNRGQTVFAQIIALLSHNGDHRRAGRAVCQGDPAAIMEVVPLTESLLS